ncbi:Transposable element Tcb1 transposase [Araneus ventricosus]|uniref:Transposable element Tcb1 transposase n=1 Tax=Araneus ventricosus TaxID=182803 RepID=A0A4Y2UQH6_ARAVE|nr:Transposable element Tcb1 transposase [Araneus ventricosus]
MGRKKSEISIGIRKLTICHWKPGSSERKISEIVNVSNSTVHNIISKYKKTKSVKNRPRTGRPRCFTELEERWIVRKVICNPKTSAMKLILKAQQRFNKSVSPETVRDILRKYNFHGRVARRKPFLSKAHQRARLEFAKSYIKKPPEFWNSVLFVDESKYNVFGSDGKQMVWRKPNSELEMKNLTPSVKHGGGSQMVWGCMSAMGVGNLHFIDGITGKYMYLDILKQNLKQSAEKMGILPHYKLYQDNDPKHNAHICRLWALYHCPQVIRTPAQSPDLNPIENIWDHLNNRIREFKISSKNELREKLMSEWDKMEGNVCANLVKSMPKRLNEVIKCKRGPTHY